MFCVSKPGRDRSDHVRDVMCSGIQHACVAKSKYVMFKSVREKEFHKKIPVLESPTLNLAVLTTSMSKHKRPKQERLE